MAMADEVTGGYMYFHKAPTEEEFDKERHRRLDDIYTYDVLRSDKSISSNGLEPRTPFLDKEFVNAYLSIPIKWRYHPGNKQCEKYMLRKAFDGTGLLPDSVLWRTKEAFSDGVSSQTKFSLKLLMKKLMQLMVTHIKWVYIIRNNILITHLLHKNKIITEICLKNIIMVVVIFSLIFGCLSMLMQGFQCQNIESVFRTTK